MIRQNTISLSLLLTLSAAPMHVLAEDDPLDVLSPDYSFVAQDDLSTNRLRGQLRPVNFTVLSAGIDGRLSSFHVKTGSTLEKGDLIAQFYCEQERAEYQITAAKVAVTEKNLEVNRKLDEYQNISEFDLIVSEAEMDIARAEVRRIKSVIDQCEIRSPFNATVTEKYAQAYQYAKKGDPLLEIVGTESLEIEMVVASLDVLRYRRGLPFEIVIDETGLVVKAEVDRVVNVIDPISQTIRVIGTITGPSANLMPGMSGVVRFDQD